MFEVIRKIVGFSTPSQPYEEVHTPENTDTRTYFWVIKPLVNSFHFYVESDRGENVQEYYFEKDELLGFEGGNVSIDMGSSSKPHTEHFDMKELLEFLEEKQPEYKGIRIVNHPFWIKRIRGSRPGFLEIRVEDNEVVDFISDKTMHQFTIVDYIELDQNTNVEVAKTVFAAPQYQNPLYPRKAPAQLELHKDLETDK